MKLIFKGQLIFLLFLILENAIARDLILIENLAELEAGKNLTRIIQEKFNIPRRLITQKNLNQDCSKKSEAILHLCLKKNGDLEIVSMNKSAIESMLGVFLEDRSEGNI